MDRMQKQMTQWVRTVAFSVVAIGAASVTTVAQANNVAVADSNAAVLASNYAKTTVQTLNNSLKPQRDRLEQLQRELQALQARFEKDAKVMSDKDRQALQAQAQSKLNEFNSTGEGLQRRIEDTQTSMLKVLMPKMEKVVEGLRKEGGYDIIIEKKYAIWANPTVDLTTKMTERLNSMP